jgi:hypothetical protein
MSVRSQLRSMAAVLPRAKRNRLDLVRALARRPQLALGTMAYETAIATSASVDTRLKILAELKVAAIVRCEHGAC